MHRKVVEDYFSILRDLLISYELPVFTKRAKREMMTKRKFYFFDVGLYRTLGPKGPLDSESELTGPQAQKFLVFGGKESKKLGDINIISAKDFFLKAESLLMKGSQFSK